MIITCIVKSKLVTCQMHLSNNLVQLSNNTFLKCLVLHITDLVEIFVVRFYNICNRKLQRNYCVKIVVFKRKTNGTPDLFMNRPNIWYHSRHLPWHILYHLLYSISKFLNRVARNKCVPRKCIRSIAII